MTNKSTNKPQDNGKHPGGRPPFFSTPEEMQILIDKYFLDCDGVLLVDKEGVPTLDKYGNVIMYRQKPYTVTGLALALGFTSRQAVMNYQAKKMFVDTLTRAKLIIEDYANSRLFDRDGINGAKFTLINNYKDYRDKQDLEHSGKIEMPQINITK